MRVTPSLVSLVDLLQQRAAGRRDHTAYTFLESGELEGARLTWADLDARCRAVGAAIAERAPAGSRVIVMFPPGLEFVSGFLGCLYAGVIAVPTYPPSGGRVDRAIARLRGMIADSGASLVVGPSSLALKLSLIGSVVPELLGIPWIAADEIPDEAGAAWSRPESAANDIAFLQYTSGSTAAPRGVMVSHGNLLHNLASSARLASHDDASVSVSWLPVNHDMGLIEGVLQPAYSGFPAYLMAPAAFLQRPARWLQAISRLRATQSGGPNFAYDLCVRRISHSDRRSLDLSAWRIAFNGSEPVRRSTLESFQRTFGECGFRWSTFRAAYGLAESTLLVTSSPCGEEPVCLEVDRATLAAGGVLVRESAPDRRGHRHDAAPLVASGSPADGTQVVIVDPQRRTRCDAGRIGEIWVAGPSVARGYWGRPQETAATFGAFLEGGEGPFLRTGDLGFLHGRHLFVTGRIKDVLIVRGQKHYPQDLELTAERAASALRPGCCAAFAVDCNGQERAAIVAEINASRPGGDDAATEDADAQRTLIAIRRGIADVHSIAPCAVTLVPAGSLAKTTSGKLQRFACRHAFLTGGLPILAQWVDDDVEVAVTMERAAS